MKAIYVILLMIMIIIPGPLSAQLLGIKSIYYQIVYDPVEDTGLLSIDAEIFAANCSIIYIPVNIAGEAEYVFLNYTAESGLIVDGTNYDASNGYFEFFTCGSGVLTLLFFISNMFEELGALSYHAVIDTSVLENSGILVQVDLILHGNFTLLINNYGDAVVYFDKSSNAVRVQGPGEVDIVLIGSIEEEIEVVNTTVLTTINTQTHSTITTRSITTSTTSLQASTTSPLLTEQGSSSAGTTFYISSTPYTMRESITMSPSGYVSEGKGLVNYNSILIILALVVIAILICILRRSRH